MPGRPTLARAVRTCPSVQVRRFAVAHVPAREHAVDAQTRHLARVQIGNPRL